MKKYIGTKTVQAEPMNELEAVLFQRCNRFHRAQKTLS